MIDDNQSLITEVSVMLANGEKFVGAVYGFSIETMDQLLNKPSDFVTIVLPDGGLSYVGKSQIAMLRSSNGRPGLALPARSTLLHQLLGLSPDATPDAVRLAFIDQVARYSPAQYGGAVLPDEVRQYIEEMHDLLHEAYQAYITPRSI